MSGRADHGLRLTALLVAFTIFAGAGVARLAYWQVVEAPGLVVQATSRMTSAETAALPRGAIVDRDGVTLAQSTTYDRLDANPTQIPEEGRAAVVETLAGILGLDEDAQARYLQELARPVAWTWLERRITAEQSLAIQLAKDDGMLPGIELEPQVSRVYPRKGGEGGTSLASQLVGFVAGDGGGTYGVEGAYEERLSGREASPVQLASIAGPASGLDTALAGLTAPPLRLTIDADLQKQVEIQLSHILATDDARSVSAVLMDPYSGAILASASVPAYDANEYAEVFANERDLLRDRVISDMYEPGSVMKMLTVAAALSAGVATPNTRITDRKALYHPGSEPVQNADRRSIGTKPVKTMIAESRNVATALIARRLGGRNRQKAARLLYRMWERAGVVGTTGVDLAGEAAGIATNPAVKAWAPVELDNRAFGQGISTTLLQLARAYAPLMNGGLRVEPHVVADGEAAAVSPERILTPKVARQTQSILTWVTGSVTRYAEDALLHGYMIGGKTGTGQIWDAKKGQFKERRYNHTFIGFVGSDRPEVLIAVRIEEPVPLSIETGAIELTTPAAAFNRLADAAVRKLGIRKSKDRHAGWPIPGTKAGRALPGPKMARHREDAQPSAERGAAERQSRRERASAGEGRARAQAGTRKERGLAGGTAGATARDSNGSDDSGG